MEIQTRKQLLKSSLFQEWLNGFSNHYGEFSKFKFTCDQCKQTCDFASINPQDWWIDQLENFEKREPENKRIFDICHTCIENNSVSVGEASCDRCGVNDKYGEGKWVIGGNLLYNYLYEMTLCLDCNEKLYYNK